MGSFLFKNGPCKGMQRAFQPCQQIIKSNGTYILWTSHQTRTILLKCKRFYEAVWKAAGKVRPSRICGRLITSSELITLASACFLKRRTCACASSKKLFQSNYFGNSMGLVISQSKLTRIAASSIRKPLPVIQVMFSAVVSIGRYFPGHLGP